MWRVLAFFVASFALANFARAQFGPLLAPAQAPQARSEEELDAHLEVITSTEPHAIIRKVDLFASQFPKSELLGIAYQYQMRAFLEVNDFDRMMAAGEKALAANPDNLNTLLTLAPALANQAPHRQDRAKLFAQAEDEARRALAGIDRTQIPRKISLDHWELEKREMQAKAHEVLGAVALDRGQFQKAAEEFGAVVRLAPNPQGVQFLRLGMAYAVAGATAEAESALHRAADLGPDDVRRLAVNELNKLTRKDSPRK